jgi:L-ascorbate metabolism protein UlaG (beta-lactamase superfamily)
MKRVAYPVAAALAALLLLPLAALAQGAARPPGAPEPPRPGMRVPGPTPMPKPISLTWFGQAAFLIRSPTGASVLVDPFSPEIGLAPPKEKLSVDAVAITHEHFDHTGVEAFVADQPKVLRGLVDDGKDYAKIDENFRGLKVTTIPSFHDDSQGKERGKNAIFVFELGGFRIAHLGDFGQAKLTPEQKRALGTVDIVLVPVGGHFTIGPKEAAALVKDIDPRKAAIPMHYQLPGLKVTQLGPVDEFLAEFPADRVRREKDGTAEWLPTPRDVPGFNVVVLSP